MSSRTLFADYAGQKCYTLIESDMETDAILESREDAALRFLNGETVDETGALESLQFVVTFVCNDGQETYRGNFDSSSSEPSGILQGLKKTVWLQWLNEVFLQGEFDPDYEFKVLDTENSKKFTVTKDFRGVPSRILFEIECFLTKGDFFNLGDDIAVKYEQELVLRRRIRQLMLKNEQLQRDFDECQKINEQHAAANQRVQDRIEKVVIPMFNEQKRLLREQNGVPEFEPFESIKKESLINWQRPDAPVKFDYNEEHKDKYRQEIEQVSPRKRKRKTAAREPTPDDTSETQDDDSTISTDSTKSDM
ncbi:hypothetical protein KL930_000818 [Ogataea haglerorum]|uniref:Uncharacterized protein n=1 Tax=Ogataea haglerorum TaxID=1937702 RepID=A0ABQ7RNR8_9ASCO|nr:uncharacterized protein KL911_003501 [Ogataea haglerorum]KAG7700131.1 hypothetical protein KL915_000820 [Ogataea haglerorum]KAG7701788.1 hypothetical protein KL951_000244 [Ogataea haglerorum]KAG7711602.1 hypothetical protein KL914_000244 [Ogataea haglerorum]KAG7712373.1 hypothetical protein KL950_000244 [Ogataea haglerorum]KAG7742903.1 hypothetical protein KL923_000518 [Ogataea haglerorum]